MANGIHKHGRGWRATISVATRTFDTEQEAEAAMLELRTRVQMWRSEAPAPAPQAATPGPPRLNPWRPSCDYALLRALHGPDFIG